MTGSITARQLPLYIYIFELFLFLARLSLPLKLIFSFGRVPFSLLHRPSLPTLPNSSPPCSPPPGNLMPQWLPTPGVLLF